MIRRMIAAGATVTGVAALALTSASPASAATTTTPSCEAHAWQANVQGAPPNFTAGSRGGDYLWHTSTGFHLRVTHRGDNRQAYSGVIRSQTPMAIKSVRLERGDVAALSADRKTLVFRFVDYGHIDGVDFTAVCSPTLTISNLKVGTANLPASRVYLGRTEHHPAAVPFTLRRV
jgi:hypothetical protein